MSDLTAFCRSAVVALNVLVLAAFLLWLALDAFGLFLFLGAWPLVGGAAFFITWIGCPSPGQKAGRPGVRGLP